MSLIAEIFRQSGESLDLEKDFSFWLADEDMVWYVEQGRVKVFAVPLAGELPAGRRRFLFEVSAGGLLWCGKADIEQGISLLAACEPDTRIREMDKKTFWQLTVEHRDICGALLENWVVDFYTGVLRDVPPAKSVLLEAGLEVTVWEDSLLRPKNSFLWVKLQEGTVKFLALEGLPRIAEVAYFPLASSTSLAVSSMSRLQTLDTLEFLQKAEPWSALDSFHHLLLALIRLQQEWDEEAEFQRLKDKQKKDREFVQKAMSRLTSVLDRGPGELTQDSEDLLLLACRQVVESQGITLVAPPAGTSLSQDPLGDIVKASQIRTRKVILKGYWWKQDNGPCLAYREEDGMPVALVQSGKGAYDLYDPLAKTKVPLTNALARSLKPFAYVFYRPLPARAISLRDLLAFGLCGQLKRDLLLMVLLALAGGILAMAVPVLTGILFDSIIPAADSRQLGQVAALLLAFAIGSTCLQATQSIALLRLAGKLDVYLQSSILDRLLNLPVPFFRRYTAGDLASRAGSISVIIKTLSGSGFLTIVNGIFGFFYLFLLFCYNVRLAVVATALVLIFLAVFGLLLYRGVHYTRLYMAVEGKISGLVLQILGGITKFRVAGAENQAFYLWAEAFSEQRKYAYQSSNLSAKFSLFNLVYPLLASMAIFSVMGFSRPAGMSTGQFLAFNIAFAGFLGAVTNFAMTIVSAISIIPLYERARPILETPSEVDEIKDESGVLTGDLEINHLSFRYHAGGQLILKDISMRVRPGEFIAVVGTSGSGKSTLLRLLLGFEAPDSGGVYYDGKDLAGLDVQSVRRQMGVVLQNGRLMAGNIFNNIVGSLPLTLPDAWDAAALVGLAEDIQQMPMGMHTVINEGSTTISGGQRQRILIARAIVNNPRIILFDEATSALDNRTQAIVSRSLEGLNATRIVIAHRLSTIINADRIYVLDQGKIVQIGSYAELMSQEGVFARLARRQLA